MEQLLIGAVVLGEIGYAIWLTHYHGFLRQWHSSIINFNYKRFPVEKLNDAHLRERIKARAEVIKEWSK